MVVIISSRQSSRHQDAHDILISGGELQTDDRGCMVMYQRQKCVTLKLKREILPSEKKTQKHILAVRNAQERLLKLT